MFNMVCFLTTENATMPYLLLIYINSVTIENREADITRRPKAESRVQMVLIQNVLL
jgi:hypothetical protein